MTSGGGLTYSGGLTHTGKAMQVAREQVIGGDGNRCQNTCLNTINMRVLQTSPIQLLNSHCRVVIMLIKGAVS